MPKIIVHEKALAHLSRGLYRSPASALRELVSNAWDANATTVRINTNYPNFYQLSVEDNGDGFSIDEFINLMDGGIGNSDKRTGTQPPASGRPVIGRLGIGMLGIAQICLSFTVISKTSDGNGFRAKVTLYDLLKEKLDINDSEVVSPQKEILDSDDTEVVSSTKEIDVGIYEIEESFDPSEYKKGTKIFSDDIHPTFVGSFQKSLKDILPQEFNISVKKSSRNKKIKFIKPNLDWSIAVKDNLSIVNSLQELGDYWRLLWELSASCPIPYIDKDALPNGLIEKEQKTLESFNFQVIVDGIKLFKPIFLKGNKEGYTTHKIDEQTFRVYGKDIKIHGYIAVQESKQLTPDELRGIMIRIKNVGIGYYDQTMLDYRINEGPRSRWLTGEIYVDEGLEDALNIDRDSFNKFHPEYRIIQEYIHNILQKKIFSEVYKKIEIRSEKKQEEKDKRRSEHFHSVVAKNEPRPVKVLKQSEILESGQSPKVSIKQKNNSVEIAIPEAQTMKTKKAHRDLASNILGIFEIALQEESDEKRRGVFTRLLLDLLSKW